MSTPYGPVEYESGPFCPVCGEDALWSDCDDCGGVGLIDCFCEGMGGEYYCPFGCDELDESLLSGEK